jgi:hypothetical protein
MQINRLVIKSDKVMPLIAALPYEITTGENEVVSSPRYDAVSHLAVYAGGRSSTCREDDSVAAIITYTKSDTKRDD